jgi:hypothetical protein
VVETTRLLSEETATAELKSVAEALKKTHVVKEPVVVARQRVAKFSGLTFTCNKYPSVV